MAPRDEANQDAIDDISLANDDLPDLFPHTVQVVGCSINQSGVSS
jgi:hypothetical protein